MTPLRARAAAKLNLSLRVVGRRPDGLHLLVSEMVLLELADELLLLPGASGLRVEAGPGLDTPVTPGENLAWRGLAAALDGEPPDACLVLRKRVPIAAGLGGGSSDAAAAWHLGRAWRGATEPPTDEAVAALAELGADVPFFAARTPHALVRGVGERVTAMPSAPPDAIVLALPQFRLSTADVFAELRRGDWTTSDDDDRNDLLAPARRLRPELDDLMRLVLAAGGSPQLTGSGPTLFVRADDPARAAAIAGRLERAGVATAQTRIRTEAASIEPISDEETS